MVDNAPKKTVTVEVPEGMTEDRVKEMVKTYLPKREKSKNRDKAKRKALGKLIENHQPEFDQLLKTFKKQLGVPVES